MGIIQNLLGFRRSKKDDDFHDHREIGHPNSFHSPHSDQQMREFAERGKPNREWGEVDPVASRLAASYEKTKHRNVLETEKALGKRVPVYLNRLRQLVMWRRTDKADRQKLYRDRQTEDIHLARKRIKPRKRQLKQDLAELGERRQKLEKAIEDNAAALDIPPFVPTIVNSNRSYTLTTMSLLLGEIVGNYIAFMSLFREIILIPALLSFSIAVAISANGKFTGKILAKYSLSRDFGILVIGCISILTTLAVCIVMGLCRGQIDGSGDSGIAMAALIAINPFIFLTIVWLAYHNHLANVNRDRKVAHNDLFEALGKVKREMQEAWSELRGLQTETVTERTTIYQTYRRLEDAMPAEERSLVDELGVLKGEINVHRTDMFRIQAEIGAQLAEMVWNTRIVNLLIRKDEYYPESFLRDPHLDTRDMGFGKEVDDFEAHANAVLNDFEPNSNTMKKEKKPKNPMLHITTVALLLFSLFMSACTSNDSRFTISYLRDTSEGYQGHSQVSAQGITDLLPESDPGSAHFYYQEINGVDLNPVKHLELSGGYALQNPHEREEEVAAFRAKVAEAISSPDTIRPSKYSYIFKPVLRFIHFLRQEGLGQRNIVIIESDFMENTPDYSFHKDQTYQGAPGKALLKLEKAHGQLPNLPEFDFILVNHPKEGDFMAMKAIEFFAFLFEELRQARSVQIRASL